MSILAMTWAWGLTDLDQPQTLVLLALADAANDAGVCWPSQAEIGRKARMSDRSVRTHVRALEGLGLLHVERRATTAGRKSNIYQLNVGAVFSAGSQQPENPSGSGEPAGGEPVDNPGFPQDSSNRQDFPVGSATGNGFPVATGNGFPVASLYQTQNIQTPNPTQPSPPVPVADPGSGPVGSGADPEDPEVAAVIAASPLATTAPPAEPGVRAARPAGAGAGEGWPWPAVPAPVDPRPDPTRTQDPGGRSAAQAADTAPRRPSERLSGQQAPSGGSGVRKSRRSPSGESSARPADSERDRELIGMCLPPWQWAMDTPGARKVAAMLAERVTAGWRPGEIRARMVGDPPKDGVRHMAAFVAARLRTNVDPGYAPVLMGAAAQEAGERRAAERREATERAREAARTPEERAWDAAYAEAWAEAQSELAGAPRLEMAEWAAERAREALAAGAGEAAAS